MASADLPDDVNDWPDDPRELLGVNRGTSQRDVRLAYTRLIRKYRPDTHPAEFGRIRDAYELIKVIASLEPFVTESDQGFTLVEESPTNGTLGTDSERADATRGPNAERVKPLGDSATWQLACRGDRLALYSKLAERRQQRPNEADAYLKLYWLLTAEPQLDAKRVAPEWLLRGLLATEFDGRLASLLQREVRRRPALGLAPAYARLLEMPRLAPFIPRLLEWRWQSLAAHDAQGDLIAADVDRARPVVGADLERWPEVLGLAVGHLAWLQDDATAGIAFARYQKELSAVPVSVHEQGGALSWTDWSVELAEAARCLSTADLNEGPLRAILEQHFRFHAAPARRNLLAWLDRLLAEPQVAIDRCERMLSKSPTVFGSLCQMVGAHSPMVDRERAMKRLCFEPAVFDFFHRNKPKSYEKLRLPLLELCCHEVISPDAVADTLRGQAEVVQGTLAQWADRIQGDAVLEILFRARMLLAA